MDTTTATGAGTMGTSTPPDAAMTADEAMTLRKGDTVMVRRTTSSRYMRALVVDAPFRVDRWALVPVSYASRAYGASVDTYSRHEHVVQVGTEYSDKVVRA